MVVMMSALLAADEIPTAEAKKALEIR